MKLLTKKFSKSPKDITFVNVIDDPSANLYCPKPASQFIPEWYKQTDSYIGGEKKWLKTGTPSTIKRCMPVFDSIVSGYIITTSCDIDVSQEKFEHEGKTHTQPYFSWRGSMEAVLFHPIVQNPNYGIKNDHLLSYPKFNNLWGIKTPKGYSVLIVQPFHRPSPWSILPAVVDTDEYNAPLTFPFILNDIKWEGFIPAGTPIAQIIPFKREKWANKLNDNLIKQEANRQEKILFSKMYDGYKNLFRQVKEYK